MAVLGDKENAEITESLKTLVKNKLPEDKQGRELDSIEQINLVNWEIDSANSNRNKITVSSIRALPKIWLKNRYGGTTNNNLQLRNNKPIIFLYDDVSDTYKISNEDEIILFDTSPI